MKKKIIRTVSLLLKLIIAVCIIAYMVRTGRLDFAQVLIIADKPALIVQVVLLLLMIYILMSVRWYVLLRGQNISTTLAAVVGISFTSLFFSSFLPGAVSGDLIKAYYVAKKNKNDRTKALLTILVDRTVGLTTLIIVSIIALGLNYEILLKTKELQVLFTLLCLILFGIFLGLLVLSLISIEKIQDGRGIWKTFNKLPGYALVVNIITALAEYNSKKGIVVKAVGITLVIDSVYVLLFLLIGRSMGEHDMSIVSYFSAVPVGVLATTIPLTPAGIGLGQSAFYAIFVMFGARSGKIGSTIITVYQLLVITLNLCFFPFYLLNNSKIKKTGVEMVNEEYFKADQ